MGLRHALLIGVAVVVMSASEPAKHKFTDMEQQRINVATPGLFSRSDAFIVDFSTLGDRDFCFPLISGEARLTDDKSVELSVGKDSEVKAMFDGKVRLSRKLENEGNVVVIRHRNGLETVYAGNGRNTVVVGDDVKAGQTVAFVGNGSGQGTGEFSIMINGEKIDPSTLLDIDNRRLLKRTLTCRKNGSHVEVTAEGEEQVSVVEENTDVDPFANSSIFKLNLDEMAEDRWAFPLPGAKLISPYGGRRRHSGVDLKTRPNDEIVAAFSGVVTRSSPYSGYGNCIVIKHSYGFETLYSHQSKNIVKVGDKVKAGQVIGLTGRTGRATTEHLHFEVKFKGRRINPVMMFDCANHCLQHVTLTLKKNGSVSSQKNKN